MEIPIKSFWRRLGRRLEGENMITCCPESEGNGTLAANATEGCMGDAWWQMVEVHEEDGGV